MSRNWFLLPVLLAAATLTSAQTVRVGDPLPPTQLDGLTQTEARSFSDFYGRTVLLEFFAYWCGPCAAQVPHVNELQEKFGARGFSVIGVTAEGAQKTEPWIRKNGAKYAFGYDTTNTLHKQFEVNSIPFAVLVDPYGTVVWTGHPGRLPEAKIEAALAGALAKPAWQWPAEARPLAALMAKGDYAAALRAATALTPADGFDAAALVKARVAGMVSRFEGLLEQKEYSAAVNLGTMLEKEFAGLPEGDALSTRMNALRADAEVMREVAAAAKLADLEARAVNVHKASEAKKMREEVAQFVEEEKGRKYEHRARKILEALERALSQVKKDP